MYLGYTYDVVSLCYLEASECICGQRGIRITVGNFDEVEHAHSGQMP